MLLQYGQVCASGLWSNFIIRRPANCQLPVDEGFCPECSFLCSVLFCSILFLYKGYFCLTTNVKGGGGGG